ncbi:MAG TPA: DNA polymerase I [Gammaproteobacteria bacterium]|nr:DNA polymerase I [Gammaproteobacteria bacterium]
MSNNQKLILVDGSSYLFRAYHAMPELSNNKGEPTGAIYGVVNMMRRLSQSYPNDKIIIVFDAKGKNFRNDLYPEYKANRPPMPEDLAAQIMPLHEILEAMGYPLLIVDGVEADDVIGTLSSQAAEEKIETIISTGDKDMAQLVNEHVTLINTMTDTCMDVDGVVEKFGVPPERIVDYLALIGDTSDNIPGVPKVGPKTAVKWLKEYGSLQGIIENADKIKGKVGESLRNSLDQLPLSYKLATIKCDVDMDIHAKDLTMHVPDKESLKDKFSYYGFRTWYRELENDSANGADSQEKTNNKNTEKNYQIILEKTEFETWLDKLTQAPLFAFDTETTSLDYIDAEIVGVSFSVKSGEAAYVPVAHDYENAPAQLNRDWVLAQLKPLLENPDKKIVGQNLKYDMSVLKNYDITLKGIEFDTMLESYVLDSVATRHDMDSLAAKYLELETIHFEDIAGKGVKQKTFNQIELAQAGPYAAEDADITLRLHETLWQQLSETESLKKVFQEIEMPLVPVLSSIERNGVLVDADLLKKQSQEITEKLNDIQKQAYEVAGEEFNLNSPKQIQTIFFEKLSLPVIKKTPKGQPSTAEAVLQELAEEYELPKLILDHRGLSKLKSTYTDRLPEQINAKTGRVHTSYHQAVAATGRLSSTNPNLQNIPIRSAEGRRIRQAFIAPDNCKILAADYSQIELRIMAHLSADEGLLSAFKEGKDIHKSTAAEIFDLELDKVSSEQRRRAKAINFGLIYGMSAFGLARQLGIERGEAQTYMEQYFHRYPGVKQYMEETRERAKDQGYVETIFGRRLYLPEINARNAMRRQYAERTAINAPMQGSAADIIKLAMIKTQQWLEAENNPNIKMIMQVHDELVFELPEDALQAAKEKIRDNMQSAATLNVPLIVDIGVGNNWDEAH